jgi:hypothetical protein
LPGFAAEVFDTLAFSGRIDLTGMLGLEEPDFGDTASRLEAAEATPHNKHAERLEAKNLFIFTSFHNRNTCQN